MLDYRLLAACISVILGSLLYFFYWNRFIAFLLSIVFRISFWQQGSSSVWLDIGSIHFAPLAGRILLKGVRYHSSNQTVRIVKAQILWRYWIRRPTTEEDLDDPRIGGEDPDKHSNRSRACRIQVSFQGLEWFMYNRTAAYDNIASAMANDGPTSRPESHRRSESINEPRRTVTKPSGFESSSIYSVAAIKLPRFISRMLIWFKRQLPSLDPKDLLPIGMEATKGAIVCGNGSTPSLLVAEFSKAEGTFGIVHARSKFDLHKQILSFKFQKALIRYVDNDQFPNPMTTTGRIVQEHIEASRYMALPRVSYLTYRGFAKLWRRLQLYTLPPRRHSRFTGSQSSSVRIGRKSHKSLDEETPVGAEFATIEYAVERKFLETPVLEISYYADVVGKVPTKQQGRTTRLESFDIGNGDLPPQWGIDIVVRGGFFRYGPWADRQRADLQRTFFPPAYHDIEATPYLQPGDQRLWTVLKVFIELRDQTTLHIPFREASKNWQWDGQVDVSRPKKREPALLRVTAGDSSTISYMMPMIAGPTGYESLLEVHLDSVAVTSSLNDIRLLTAESCRVRGELPTPSKWNSERQWKFAASLRQPVIYILRDHINMFTDLGKDWVSGPPADYYRFVPTIYVFELDMHHFELNFYVNDQNIIDKPLIKDENAILMIRGPRLRNETQIPANIYRPEATSIPFFVEAPNLSFALSLPRWNTHASNYGNHIGRIGVFRLDASYRYYAEVHQEYIEQFRLEITVRDIMFKALGWTIRYLMVMRENYFGTFTNFSTLYEYLDKRRQGLPVGDPVELRYREGKANILQVEIGVFITSGQIVLPAGLPGYETSDPAQVSIPQDVGVGSCIILTVPELQLHFRLHDHYMEMSLNVDTISGSVEHECPDKQFLGSLENLSTKEKFMVDGIDITANRLFGPQPRTSAYLCIWEICLGRVKAVLSAAEGRILAAAGAAFRLNFLDMANAPASEYTTPLEPDVTFLKISLNALDTTWLAGHAALEVSLPCGLSLEMNDLAGTYYRRVTSLRVPQVCLKVLITTPSGRHTWLEAAQFTSDASLDIYFAPAGWRESGRVQADYILSQDVSTGRAKFLFDTLPLKHDIRSLHKNGLLLPRPRPSKSVAIRRVDTRQKPPNETGDTALDMQPRWLHRSHLSDSDGEEGVSEADRDARLAQSRILAISTSNPEEQSMSSGDESDNVDLTDGETTDSDWSDTAGLGGDRISSMGQYHRVTNHYTSRFLKTPSLWDGSPFTLTRNVPFLKPVRKHTWTKSDQDTVSIADNISDINEGVDMTTFRFHSRRDIDIRITPLITPAIMRLEEDIATKSLSVELTLDGLTANFLGDFTGSAKSSRSTTNFDIHLSLICMRVVQIVSFGKPSMCLQEPEVTQLGRQNATATIDMRLDGCHIMGNIAKENRADPAMWLVVTTIHDVSLDLNSVASTNPSQHDLLGDVEIFVSGLEGKLGPDKADIGMCRVSVNIGHSSPEYVAATGLALADSVEELSRIYKRWSVRASTSTQNLLYGILDASADKSIVDPYSTIQPSYLVQRGRPNKLRTDPILVLLHYLRRCLREMGPSERQAIRPAYMELEPDVLLKKLLPLLESRLVALALDAEASNDRSIDRLFPSLRLKAQESTGRHLPFTFWSLKIGRADLVIRDPDRRLSPSQYSLTSLAAAARIRAPKLFSPHVFTSAVLSQTSLRDRSRYNIRQYSASISIGDINLTILPHLMNFAQRVLRVHRRYSAIISPSRHAARSALEPKLAKQSTEAVYLVLTFCLQSFRVEAAAENLVCVFGLSGIQMGSTIFAKPVTGHQGLCDQSMNHSIVFDQILLRARSNVGTSKRSDSDILASLVFGGGKCNAVMRQEPSSSSILRTVLFLKNLQLNVPRSAIRLYRFIEEWRADFLPGIEATLHALLTEIDKVPTKSISPTPARPNQDKPLILHVHSHILAFGVSLQVMHGTWLSWNVYHTVGYLKPPTTTTRDFSRSFGLQLASQVCSVSFKPNRSRELVPDTHVKLELPTLSISGRYSESSLYTVACMEFFQLIVKPSHWDTLLVVQQKFGQDFNDLIGLVEETRRKRAVPVSKVAALTTSLNYNGFLKMRGFRIGLEGISSTLFLECVDIGGGINNGFGRAWNIGLSDLALSLAPRVSSGGHATGFNRNHRSAFVIIDFQASTGSRSSEGVEDKALHVSVTKIHAVMQPSSIGEVGDFIDHLQAEMLEHKERRAAELKEFKEKTKSVLRTFEVKDRDAEFKEKSSWLSEHTIVLVIKNIGVAFPLALDQDIQLPQTGSHDSRAVRAFLFSIKSFVFGSQRGETGQAVMKGFSFQFVSQFRQSISADFSGETHLTRNRLVYPEMTAQLRSETSTSSRQISISASVSGFVLDIDSSIPDDIFSIIDVYRQGQERVTRLADNIPRITSPSSPTSAASELTGENQYAALPTSSILASLTFLSGKVRVYSGSASALSRRKPLSAHAREPTDAQFLEFGTDLFKLPMVSVWTEYRATPAAQKFGSNRSAEPSTLMFKCAIHSSHNTLRPTLLPFIAEVVKHVEIRMRKVTLRTPQTPTSIVQDATARIISDRSLTEPDAVSTLHISFGLRIDQSKLELTCQPDVNVIAGLHWDSGGFVVSVSPGASNVTFSGSVGGLTVGLKHGFLSEECVRLDARNLAFSMQFAKRVSEDGDQVSLVSVVLDTEFAGGVRFSRFQDVLCFKATWLDRIPILNGQQNSASPSSSRSAGGVSISSSPKQEFTTAVLVRIREIKLDVDLGQSISSVTIDLEDTRIRTKMTEDLYEVSLTVADVAMLAKGNISGRVTVPDCLFQTTRRKEDKLPNWGGKTKMLELTMTSGPLSIILESDHQKLLQYHAKPLEVNIFDDWSSISKAREQEKERPLRLSFIVSGPEVIAAATVGTIPKLLSYANKFKTNMDAQHEGASRESKAFQMTRSPKPDNPLSDVANAMLHSARDRFNESEAELSYFIEQHLSLRLDSLRLVVFPRTMADLEMAQFVGSDVHARLDRKTRPDGLLAKRVLHLSFSSMSVSKYSQLNHNLSTSEGLLDGSTWLTLLLRGAPEAIIVGLPSMNMVMSSEELIGAVAKELLYDFNGRFVRREGMREFEDIYITLNMSLYSWLTILRKNLSREMNQVQASSDWRTSSMASPPVFASRKKILEPLQLADVNEESSDSLMMPPRPSSSPSASPLISAPVQSPTMGLKTSSSSSSVDPPTFSPSSEPGSDVPEANISPLIPSLPPTGITSVPGSSKSSGIVYKPGDRHIERLNMRQLGEATPDVMHPFFMKKAGFNLEDSLPQYVHEYATIPIEQIIQVLLRLYSKQLRADREADGGGKKHS